MYLTLRNCTLKDDRDGKFYGTCVLPQFFKATSTAVLPRKEKYASSKTRMP